MSADEYERIEAARKTLGLGEEATRAEIQKAFRELSLKHHPDRCPEEGKNACAEEFRKIAAAKEILDRYCDNYRYSFRKEDIRRPGIGAYARDHRRRFYGDWI